MKKGKLMMLTMLLMMSKVMRKMRKMTLQMLVSAARVRVWAPVMDSRQRDGGPANDR